MTDKNKTLQIILLCGFIAFAEIGNGMILPFISDLIFNPLSCIINRNLSDSLKYIFYDMTLVFFPLGMLFGNFYLGILSDYYGRKRVILYASFFLTFSYALCGIALILKNIYLFWCGRLFSGIFASSICVAIAGVADLAVEDNKANMMRFTGLASCFGLILAPLIGIIQFSRFPFHSSPFFILFLAGNILFGLFYFFMHEQSIHSGKVNLTNPLKIFIKSLTDYRLRKINFIFFLFCFAWGIHFQYLPLYLSQIIQFSMDKLGLFFMVMVLVYVMTVLIIYPKIISRFKEKTIFSFSMLILAFIINAFYLNLSPAYQWTINLIFAVLLAIPMIFFTYVYSKSVEIHEQGYAIGCNNAILSLGTIVTALGVASLASVHLALPFQLESVFFLVCFVMFLI